MRQLRRRCVLLAAVQGVAAGSAFAAVNASWTDSVSSSWTDPTAWSTNPVYPNNGQPGGADLYNAFISASNGVPYTVTLSSDITISSLVLSSPEATLMQTAGTLRLVDGGATFSAGKYVLQSGTLLSDDPVTFKSRFDWNGGTLGGFGSFEIAPTALVNVGSLGTHGLSSTMNNRGVVYLSGGTISLNNGTFNNLAGGVLNISAGGAFLGSGSTNLINNSGLINIDTNKAEVNLGAPLLNSGTINVDNASLRFSSTSATYTNGAVFSGSGTVDFGFGTSQLAGTLTLNGSNAIMSGGTLAGAGNLQVNGVLNWNSGTMSGVGATNIAHGGVMNLGTLSGTHGVLRVINNDGLIDINSSGFTFSTGTTGAVNNLADGVINISGSSSLPFGSGGGSTALVSNFGLINVNSSSSVTFTSFVNSGTFNVQSGAASLSSGTYIYNAGATFTGPGSIDFSNGTHVVNGAITLAGNNMRFNSGTFVGPGDINVTGAMSWGGGTFGAGTFFGTGTSSSGALNVAPGGILSLPSFQSTRALSRVLNNSGTINIQGNASISFSNGTLNNLAGGVINISALTPFSTAGTSNLIRNSGTINVDSGTLSGNVSLGSSVFMQNSGTINLISGSLTLGTGTQNAGAFIGGNGMIELTGFGSQTFNGPVTLSGTNLNFNNGTISGPGDMLLRGTLNWGSGTLAGSGIVDVSSTSTVNVGTTSVHSLARLISDAGTLNLSNASINFNTGGAINILPGGVMNLSGTNLLFTSLGSLTTLTNNGRINVNGATSSLSLGSFGGFIDAGTINATNGTIVLDGGTYTTGAIITGNGFVDLTGNISTVTLNDTLNIAGSNVNFSNGTINGAGNLAINGYFTWGGGTISGSGAVNVAPGAVITVPSIPNPTRSLSRNVSNAGTINLLNSSPILISSPITINNFPGAFINIASPQPFSGSTQPPSLLNNSGTIKFTGLNTSYTLPFPLVDSGTISVSTGSLSFSSVTFNGGAFVGGPGFIDIATPTFPGTIVNGPLTLAGSNIHLTQNALSGAGNIDVTGNFNWDAGSISGAGIVTIEPSGVLTLGTLGAAHTLSRTINSSGVINLLDVLTCSGGTINNLATGVINVGSFATINPLGGVNRLTNAGTINIPAGSFNVNIPFSNTGTVNVGTPGGAGSASFVSSAVFSGGVSQLVGSTLTHGNWIVHQSSTLSFGGVGMITDNAANVLLDGPDSNFPEINGIASNTGTFAITNGRAFTTSASYANAGLTVVGPQSVLTITGQLINTGTVDVDATGIINYAPPGPVAPANTGGSTTLLDVKNQIASGYKNGAWTGPGINSDLAAQIAATPVPNKTAVGYGEASALGIIGTGTFAGQPIDDTSVVMRYTLYGDSNLDQMVNALDFNVVASNFGESGAFWTDGDFNYDGVVNTADFNLMAGNFNAGMPSVAPASGLGTLVPEPATIALIACSGALMPRRRHAAPKRK